MFLVLKSIPDCSHVGAKKAYSMRHLHNKLHRLLFVIEVGAKGSCSRLKILLQKTTSYGRASTLCSGVEDFLKKQRRKFVYKRRVSRYWPSTWSQPDKKGRARASLWSESDTILICWPLACRSCAIERAVQRLCTSDGKSMDPSVPVRYSSGPKIFEKLDC
jgi:hypothetical protein